MRVLVLNSGSSSIKFSLFLMPEGKLEKKGNLERIGEKTGQFKDHAQAISHILKSIEKVDAVGHRVVHGAELFKSAHVVTKQVISQIKQCSKLAPLHNPANLAGIRICAKLLGNVRQVAVFDTAFHQTMPKQAFMYALPYKYYKSLGIRKYGFHGTSHEYVALKASQELKRPLSGLKLITCHLGNGSSVTAINNGKSVDTSMGFTPLAGLVMGSRCGDLDPAIVFYLSQELGLGPDRILDILNRQSGLKGLSGIGNDYREVKQAAAKGNSRARLALNVFTYRLKSYILMYFGLLKGADAVVLTGGIGENDRSLIKQVKESLSGFLKVYKTRLLVIPTNEELLIADKTYKLLKKGE